MYTSNLNQHTVSYKNSPSQVFIYELSEPLSIDEDVNLQAEKLLIDAHLRHFNGGSVSQSSNNPLDNIRGLSMADVLRQSPSSSHPSAIRELRTRVKQFIGEGYCLEDIATVWERNGETRHYKTSYHGFIVDGYLNSVVVVHRDEAVRRLQEKLVSNIAQHLAADTDDTFFLNLVSRLAQTLELDYAMVAELVPGTDDTIKILGFYDRHNQRHINADVEYCLKDTPGYEVLQGKVQVIRSGVAKVFPGNDDVRQMEIDSYIGVPVFGKDYKQLGLVTLMHGRELPNVELAHSLLNIFSIRASAEIEHRRSQKEKQKREQQQKLFIENNSSGMFVVDIDPPMPTTLSLQKQVQWLADHSRFVESNEALLELFGYRNKKDLIGKSLYGDVVTYDYATQARDFISQNYIFRDRLIRIVTGKAKDRWLSINISSVVVDGHLIQMLGVLTDVSERVRHSREMEYRAKHDSLTGLPNRSYFVEQLEQLLALSTPDHKHALFFLDLDGFKEVNDTLGHETGDYLLKEIGPRLSNMLPSKTTLARLGGDEFAVLIENYQSLDTVTDLASQLMHEIKSPFTINELELVVGGSVGIAMYPQSSVTASALMRCADIAMYQAKQTSQDYCIYSTDSDHYTVRRLSLMMDVRQAVENNELRLHYQPIVSLSDQSVIGFEALIRWQHPELGMLSPGEFIPLIELTDMIMPVTWWVIETAIKQLSEWKKTGWNYRISVNVSTRNLVDVGFVSFIAACLDRYQVDGRMLDVEITESTLMADPDKARQVLQSISALGVLISIDDYGTGYSSLAYLKSLPINTLKIDRTFISQMLDDTHDQIIVNSTIQLSHNLGLEVTAEGIEDVSLINKLANLGCDKGQGFYFSKPIPLHELEHWLSLRDVKSLQA